MSRANLKVAAPAARPSLTRAPVPNGLTRAQRKRLRLQPRPLTAAELGTDLGTASVPNPYNPERKIEVTVNRRVDILSTERAAKRITEAAFLTGRQIQETFEMAAGSTGSAWSDGSRVDATTAKDGRMVRGVEVAKAVEAEMNRLGGEVGAIGARFLRRILTGTSYADEAATQGKGTGERAVSQIAQRFRDLLEDIAQERAARGSGKARMVGFSLDDF